MNSVGIDIINIPRFQEKVDQNGSIFLNKMFSKNELEDGKETQKLAGKFAAKEAFIKAKNPTNFDLKDIQVLKENSKPYILFKKSKYSVSISHDGEYAIAIVLC